MNTKLKLIHYFNVYHQIKYALLIILTQYQSVVSHHDHSVHIANQNRRRTQIFGRKDRDPGAKKSLIRVPESKQHTYAHTVAENKTPSSPSLPPPPPHPS